MEKEFIPYEQALALKELGFSSPYPIGGYQGGAVFYYEKGNLYYDGRPMYSSDAHAGQIDAPLYQQAFRWFREKYNLDGTMSIDVWNKKTTTYRITGGIKGVIEASSYGDLYDIDSKDYDTYEEAELECLKKLIEAVKNKQG